MTARFVSLRGTSGSGKSYLARRVLQERPNFRHPPEPVYVKGRKRPLYYVRQSAHPDTAPLAVLGSYESPTGGVDTISRMVYDGWELGGNDVPFVVARKLLADGTDVFAEGLLLSAEQHRTAALHRDGVADVHLFYLTLPLEECLAGVNARRAERGKMDPVDPKTTADRHRTLRLHPPRFRELGAIVEEGDREAAAQWLVGLGLL